MKDENGRHAHGKSLSERGQELALRIIALYGELPERPLEQTLGRQILRSGTSVGAQLSEGKRSRSVAETISKTEGALQELEETVYWLKLLEGSGLVAASRLQLLRKETEELTAILVSGVKRLKFLKFVR